MNEEAAHGYMDSYGTFWLGGYRSAVSLAYIREISTVPELTPIPHAPKGVVGFFALRGEFVLALDLALWLGMSSVDEGRTRGMVILKPEAGEIYALVVEGKINIETVRGLEAEPRSEFPNSEWVQGAHDSKGEPWLMVKIDALFAKIRSNNWL